MTKNESTIAPSLNSEGTTQPRVKDLPPAARRALEEAEARRQAQEHEAAASPKEIGGRKGLDPARYGDWEVKGIACDF